MKFELPQKVCRPILFELLLGIRHGLNRLAARPRLYSLLDSLYGCIQRDDHVGALIPAATMLKVLAGESPTFHASLGIEVACYGLRRCLNPNHPAVELMYCISRIDIIVHEVQY